MKHFGDITKINGAEVPIVDVIVGGSPCQDLSIAGRREGLAGERSGLFMEQIRIIKEMRENDRTTNGRTDKFIRPRFMVWENVEGVFTANGGEDFRCVLEETARIADSNAVIPRLADGCAWSDSGCILADRWSIAWRLHDAQFWGVPQRRRRIALVADFGGQAAPEILFEREGVSRDIEPRRPTGQEPSDDSSGSFGTISFQERAGCDGGGKGILVQHERTGGLRSGYVQSVLQLGRNADITDPNRKQCGGAQRMPDKDNFNAVITFDRAAYNQSPNAKFDFNISEDVASPVIAKGPGGVMTASSEAYRQEITKE